MQSPEIFSFILIFLVLAFDACESQNCSNPLKVINVSQSDKANFRTIQSAIDSVPEGNSRWIHILISPGVYREAVLIPKSKPCIYLEGAGRNSTSIQWGGSYLNATFQSKANNTVAKGITFENTYNTPVVLKMNDVKQAKAGWFRADKCAFFDCAFLGVQDTLNDDYGRHYYHNCYIQGGVDFIYGNARTIFEESTIYFSVGKYLPKKDGVITAQERNSPNENTGFVFNHCNISGTGGKAVLGRALNPYARVIIANSYLSDVVRPEGWNALTYVNQVGNLTFVEEGCSGPGANKSERVNWMKNLSGAELQQFLNISYIDEEGWIQKLPTTILN